MTPLETQLIIMIIVMGVVLVLTQVYISKLESHKFDFGERMYKLGIDYGKSIGKAEDAIRRNKEFYEELQKLVEKK